MTNLKKYSIKEIHGMTEQFKTMVTEVVTHLISQGREGFVPHHKTFSVDGNEFEFAFRPNRALQLLGPDQEIKPDTRLAEAAFRYASGYVITTCTEDYENGVTDHDLNQITEQFINVIITNMARVYFRSNLAGAVDKAISNSEFDVIMELSNRRISSAWTQTGFSCILTDENVSVLMKNTEYNINPSPNADYKGRCYRYTELAFITAIGSLDIYSEGWKVAIQGFPRI